ncbi:CopY family transcriptional regulator [Streptomyces albus subsp. albus]|nr:CopY family transcriptional regulator [Streptomyces albus subsp. albus]
MQEPNGGRRPSGELEASVLAALWAAGAPLTPADVQRTLGQGLARTTITTILARLHEKGAVARSRSGRGYAYVPTQDSPGLTARRMRRELEREEDRETVLARFVSELSADDERVLRSLLDGGPAGSADGGPEPGSGG